MTKKTEERLRWALRYVICHPDAHPSIISEEWKISIDEAINICSQNFGTTVCDLGIDTPRRFKSFEKKIFGKLVDLK